MNADAITDYDVGTNGHVRSDLAVFANLGRRVDEDVAAVYEWLGGGGEFFGAFFGEGGEVETGAAEEVLGLADVHPEALQVE